jgi:hypothetical protein
MRIGMRFVIALVLLVAPSPAAAFFPGADGARAAYVDLVNREALLQGVPPALADAVAMVETGYQVNAVGSSGEIGLMQIMPATARQLGFLGTPADLFLPATNIHLGVQYLSRAWAASGGSVCRALMKYRAGLGEEMMTPLSITYCARAMSWLDATGSDLGRGTPLAASATPVPVVDPYVISIPAALKVPTMPPVLLKERAPQGPVMLSPILASSQAAVKVTATRPRMAEFSAGTRARFDSHVQHLPRAEKAAAAIAAALSED